MANVSSVTTAAVTLSATSLVPAVQWVASGCPHPVPQEVAVLIAAGLMSVGHAGYNIANYWIDRYMSSKANPNPFIKS